MEGLQKGPVQNFPSATQEAAWWTRSGEEMAAGSTESLRQPFLSCMAPDCHGGVSATFLRPPKGPAMVGRVSGMDRLDQMTHGIDGGAGLISPDKSGVNQRPQKNKVLLNRL